MPTHDLPLETELILAQTLDLRREIEQLPVQIHDRLRELEQHALIQGRPQEALRQHDQPHGLRIV